ncbi:TonB-dependent receptor [Pedobacter africanus]|uniref:TonB-dependent receptor n=1 Tax=Pedobacter africanus TaxID=151894 RepID=UPI000A0709FD|nr:TonB-dependent receptor [Pedobacter africanus]
MKFLNLFLRIMKLTIVIITTCLLQVSAAGFAQRITLSERNASLEKIIRKISKQSGYDFIADISLVKKAKPVSIELKGVTIEEALRACLADQQMNYIIEDKIVVLRAKQFSPFGGNLWNLPFVIEVKGKVLDENGQPLPGAGITVKGSNQSTVTDANGNFLLKNVTENAVLLISYVGYVTQEVTATKGAALSIKLVPKPADLGEVVVVGYGTTKKANLIGSVAQLSAKEINDRPVTSLSNALTGQLPGVTIIQRSGQPGSAGGNIQIRGVGSFGANPAAFILVDGVPVNSFNDIDPNDVENISVLKDASTAAIYGSRAANGVILVTTKTGKVNENGKMNISYNGYTGTQRATQYPEFVNSWEYATLMNEAQPGAYTAEAIQKFKDGSDPDNFPNVNYIDLALKKSTFQTGHNLSISNGNDKTQYLLSLGYMYQDGIVKKNNYNRYNIRLNLVNNFLPNLKLTTRLSGAQYIDNQPAPPATLDWTDMLTNISQVIRVPAVYVNKLSNGDYGLGVVAKGTPVSYTDNESFYKDKQTDLLANLRLDWDVIKGLKLSVIGGYTQLNDNSQRFLANQRINATLTLGPGTLNQGNALNTYKTLQQLAEYKRNFGGHELGILGGHTYEYYKNGSFSASRSGYNSNSLTELAAGDASTQKNGSTSSELVLDSYFARLNYNFKNRYLVEGTVRYDGSSRFSSENKYAAFPAVAVGWRLSEEGFLKDKLSWLTDLKLKASMGTLGNQNIRKLNGEQDYYPYQSMLSPNFNYPFGGALSTGVANTTLTDASIRWESTRTKDAGIDATLFKGKLNVSATYFDRYTYDILVSPGNSVSTVLGLNVGVQNSGKLSNKGWEFTAAYKENFGDFSFNINTNFSIVNNKVLDLGVGNVVQPNGMVGNGSSLFNGYPVNLYYGYLADGLL